MKLHSLGRSLLARIAVTALAVLALAPGALATGLPLCVQRALEGKRTTDERIRILERAHAADPADASVTRALTRERRRAGRDISPVSIPSKDGVTALWTRAALPEEWLALAEQYVREAGQINPQEDLNWEARLESAVNQLVAAPRSLPEQVYGYVLALQHPNASIRAWVVTRIERMLSRQRADMQATFIENALSGELGQNANPGLRRYWHQLLVSRRRVKLSSETLIDEFLTHADEPSRRMLLEVYGGRSEIPSTERVSLDQEPRFAEFVASVREFASILDTGDVALGHSIMILGAVDPEARALASRVLSSDPLPDNRARAADALGALVPRSEGTRLSSDVVELILVALEREPVPGVQSSLARALASVAAFHPEAWRPIARRVRAIRDRYSTEQREAWTAELQETNGALRRRTNPPSFVEKQILAERAAELEARVTFLSLIDQAIRARATR